MRKVGAVAVVVLLVACAPAATPEQTSGQQPVPTTTSVLEVPTTTTLAEVSTTTTVGMPVSTVSEGAEAALVASFVRFAQAPTDDAFSELPLADSVGLGLGPTIMETVASSELRDAETWVLDLDMFRAYVGPFSAVELLSRLDDYETTVGEHPHCASPPVPAPAAYGDLTRISVEPAPPVDSCLDWFTVDFFVLPNGDVAAVTLDLWEP